MRRLFWVFFLLIVLMGSASAQVEVLSDVGITVEVPDDLMADQCVYPVQQADYDLGILSFRIIYMHADEIESAMNAYNALCQQNPDDGQTLQKAYSDLILAVNNATYTYYMVYGFREDNLESLKGYVLEEGVEYEELGSNCGYSYFAKKYDEPAEGMSEAAAAAAEACRPIAEKMEGTLDFTDVVEQKAALPEDSLDAFPAFSTVDLEGNPVTEEIFSQADLTVVNVWGTYCGPCINEMPQLAAWAKELPENVQVIGIVIDVGSVEDSTCTEAKKIAEEAGARYTNLIVCKDMSPLLEQLTGVPTTLFVDSTGHFAAGSIAGAYVQDYKDTVEYFLNR